MQEKHGVVGHNSGKDENKLTEALAGMEQHDTVVGSQLVRGRRHTESRRKTATFIQQAGMFCWRGSETSGKPDGNASRDHTQPFATIV